MEKEEFLTGRYLEDVWTVKSNSRKPLGEIRIRDAGNSIIIVGHNKQLIAQCDWAIDLRPDGGEKGGEIIYMGTPKQ